MRSEDMLYKLISFLDDTHKDFEVFDRDGKPITDIFLEDGRIYITSACANDCDCDSNSGCACC